MVRERACARVCRIEMLCEQFLLHLGLALSPALLQKGLVSSHAPPLVAQSAHARETQTRACTQSRTHVEIVSLARCYTCTCCTHPSIHAHVLIYTYITARTLERTNHARALVHAHTHTHTHARKHARTHPKTLAKEPARDERDIWGGGCTHPLLLSPKPYALNSKPGEQGLVKV
jgi:hypothetical protein